MKTSRVILSVLCALAVSAVAARADIAPRWSDDQLAQFSSAIVEGRVTDVSVGRDVQTNAIYTYVTVAVDDVVKGDVPEREIVVKQLGGRIGDLTLAVSDQPTFSRGENVLLFLETRPRDGTLYTTALWQGKWTLSVDAATGDRIALRQSPDGAARGALGERERRTLDPFTTRLRATSSGGFGGRRFVAAPSADEMRLAVSQSVASAPFEFLGPYRWNEFDTGAAVPFDVQSTGQPGLAGGGVSELARAQSIWNAPSGFRFSAGGNTNRCEATAGQGIGHISIVFMDPCNEIDNAGGVLAVGGAYYTSSGGRTVGGTTFGRVVDGFIVNNDSTTALRFMQNSNCFAAVDTHELGHVLGLGHSADATAIMFTSVSFTTCSAALIPPSADDIAGIRAIYPGTGGGTTAPGAPTSLTATASGSNVTVSWGAPASGGTPTSYFLEAGSRSGLSDIANFNTGSTSTTFSTSGVPNGTYFVRARAMNSSGTSAASNEATLVVGGSGCTAAPGAPGGLTLVSNSGGTVVFSWTAAPGSPSTYIVEAGSAAGASNVATIDLGGTSTTLTASAPRGTYFVRVRGKNACGTGAVSNEVTLVVP